MYTFVIKEEGRLLELVITRAMLVLSALVSFICPIPHYFFINVTAGTLLLLAALFIKAILVKWRMPNFILLFISAILLFIATHSFGFAIILFGYGYAIQFLYKKPVIFFSTNGVVITKRFIKDVFKWGQFENIILKDELLTLDFKSNKLIQVNIEESSATIPIEENEFNRFCKSCIQSGVYISILVLSISAWLG